MIHSVEKAPTGTSCSPDLGGVVNMGMALSSGLPEAPEICPAQRLQVACLMVHTVLPWHSWMALFAQL